jgi:hypothetical protein
METSLRHASESKNERYRGKARDRRYEVTKVVRTSSSENSKWGAGVCIAVSVCPYGGESNAENCGVNEQSVHALSGVGSWRVDRDSYAYENSIDISDKYKWCVSVGVAKSVKLASNQEKKQSLIDIRCPT